MMRDAEQMRQIELLGEEDTPDRKEPRESGGSLWPLIQVILCALLLTAAAVLKMTDGSTYRKAVDWYRREIVREIELPRWESGVSVRDLGESGGE